MKGQTYFVFAVTFALVVPIIFGSVYFYKLYREDLRMDGLARLDISPEVINYEEDTIVLKDFNSSYYDFDIDNRKDVFYERNVSIVLSNIIFPTYANKENMTWILYQLEDEDHVELVRGSFENLKDNKILLTKVKMGINEIKKFRLHLKYESDLLQLDNFKAKIKIE